MIRAIMIKEMKIMKIVKIINQKTIQLKLILNLILIQVKTILIIKKNQNQKIITKKKDNYNNLNSYNENQINFNQNFIHLYNCKSKKKYIEDKDPQLEKLVENFKVLNLKVNKIFINEDDDILKIKENNENYRLMKRKKNINLKLLLNRLNNLK